MAILSDSARQHLLNNRARAVGVIVRTKDFTKQRMRVLPGPESAENPGAFGEPYVQIWSQWLKKFLTSPRTFGLKCPVLDALDLLWQQNKNKPQDEKDTVRAVASGSFSTACKVIYKGDLGTVDDPHVKIFPFPGMAYDWVVKGTEGNVDIIDPKEGRWFNLIQVRDPNTKKSSWVTDTWSKDCLISNDEAVNDALVAKAATMSITGFASPVDWDSLSKIYRKLMGKPIPSSYLRQKGVNISTPAAEKELPVDDEGGTVVDTSDEGAGGGVFDDEGGPAGDAVAHPDEAGDEGGAAVPDDEGGTAGDIPSDDAPSAASEGASSEYKYAVNAAVILSHPDIEAGKAIACTVTGVGMGSDGTVEYTLTDNESNEYSQVGESNLAPAPVKAPTVVRKSPTVSRAPAPTATKATGKATAPAPAAKATAKPSAGKASDKVRSVINKNKGGARK